MKTFQKYTDIPVTVGSKAQWDARGFVVCKFAKPIAKAHLIMPGFIHSYNLYGIEQCRPTKSSVGARKRAKYFEMLDSRKVQG